MEITDYSRLNYSVDDINGYLQKARVSLSQEEVRDQVTLALTESLASVAERFTLLETNVAEITQALQDLQTRVSTLETPPEEPEEPETSEEPGEENSEEASEEGELEQAVVE